MKVKSTLKVTNETNRKMRFTVDKKTRRSYIELHELAYRDTISFKPHYQEGRRDS